MRESEQMPLDFLYRREHPVAAAAVFPGAWNPPTIAHVEIARAALGRVEEVVWVIPRQFPHKTWEGADFRERCQMLRELAAATPGFSAAMADGGLYVEIAREARQSFGPEAEIGIVCGRDAAERIERWDYGIEGVFAEIVREFPLLVAARAGEYSAGAPHQGRIASLELETSFDNVSSSEVRRRIAAGEPWRSLVPDAIADHVARIYTRKP